VHDTINVLVFVVLRTFWKSFCAKTREKCNSSSWTRVSTCSLKIDEIDESISYPGLEVAKTRFQTFLRGKGVLFKWKCQIREFYAHGMERGEVLKRYFGWKKEATLLKQTPKDRTFIQTGGAIQ